MYNVQKQIRSVNSTDAVQAAGGRQAQRKDKDRPTRVASKLSYLQMWAIGCDRATGLMPVPENLILMGLAFITPTIFELMWS